ncbi:flagellar assembly peptidoglycan hydrolase FlgJ [Oxalobacteraceae bacterium A2-2]
MSNSTPDINNQLALDIKGMGAMRQSARAGSPEALKNAATQFEALFVNMMLKSMRDATPQDGLMDSQQSKMFTTMLDQQTSQNIAKKGIGLADVLVRQLSQQGMGQVAGADGLPADPFASALGSGMVDAKLKRAIEAAGGMAEAGASASTSSANASASERAGARSQAPHVREFQDKLGAHAEEASRATGIPAKFMLGQAALESGWGKRQIRGRDGTASNNLFGIKAGPDWKGKVVVTATTEYVNGKPQTRMERFRAYDSYADSFKDYAKLLASNPRYEKVLASAGDAASFAQGLQRAGYATDPHYASKLTRIIRQSLVG